MSLKRRLLHVSRGVVRGQPASETRRLALPNTSADGTGLTAPVYTFAIKPEAGSGGTISEGTLELTRDASTGVSGDSRKTLLNNGNAYVNVHTKNFPGGELRGQVMMKR